MDTILLVGAEDLTRAMYSLRSVADSMQRAADTFDAAAQNHQRFMDDWLQRFESAMESKK